MPGGQPKLGWKELHLHSNLKLKNKTHIFRPIQPQTSFSTPYIILDLYYILINYIILYTIYIVWLADTHVIHGSTWKKKYLTSPMDLNHQKSDQQIPAPDCALWIVWSRPHSPPPICWCVECTSSGSCPDGNGRKWCQENGHWLRFYQSLIEGIKHVPLVTKQNVLIRMPNGIWVNYVKNKMLTRGKSLKAHDRLQSHSFPHFFGPYVIYMRHNVTHWKYPDITKIQARDFARNFKKIGDSILRWGNEHEWSKGLHPKRQPCQHQNHSSPTPRSGLHREVVDGDP